MKPFKINRNSWHYKFNKNFFNNDDYCMERRWEPKHNNFCSYWRATMCRMLVAAILGSVIISALAILGVVMYQDPIAFAIVFGATAGVIGGAIGCAVLLERRNFSKTAKITKSDSLFMQKYKMHKSKICPMVEYD